AVAERPARQAFHHRLISLRLQLETDFEMRFRVAAVRVEVNRIRDDPGVRFEKPGRFRIEEVGIPTHFVNGPRRKRATITADIRSRVKPSVRTGDSGTPDHVMEHVVTTDRRAPAPVSGDVVDFPDLKGGDI